MNNNLYFEDNLNEDPCDQRADMQKTLLTIKGNSLYGIIKELFSLNT